MKPYATSSADDEMLDVPQRVEEVMAQLRSDPTVKEIWLIGSRANGSAAPESDWDLLVRSDREPAQSVRRSPDIDVLCSGPSGSTLVEGEEESLRFWFTDFEWKATSCGEATYLGRRLNNYECGVARDASEPVCVRKRQRASLLWERKSA